MDTQTQGHEAKNELDLIDNLAVSNKVKEKLRLVHENLHGIKWGFPEYRPKENTAPNRMALTWKLFSVWAFLFAILYYLVKGMWRKGLVLLGLNIVLGLLFAFVTEDPALVQVSALIISVICSQSAYSDLYRKLVKKEVFWW